MIKRIVIGNLVLLSAVALSVGGTFLLDYLDMFTQNPERLQVTFGAAGIVMGFASVIAACYIYTNGFGDGIKK